MFDWVWRKQFDENAKPLIRSRRKCLQRSELINLAKQQSVNYISMAAVVPIDLISEDLPRRVFSLK